ncbi:MAG TPA: sigma 54-interacting transcriptional regulator [Bryobacteraceae bacterium]|nr:sigma 54-interacting transcriptional regulator [Bryobacteraceae bacterium]
MAILDLIGSSPKFRAVLDQVNTVASANCTVLIQGETGTGKEVIAQAIHDASPRRKNRFVALNCAAIPAALLESELFGHERGAFTGAITQAMGRFQAADRGTLFLDEIGDLPLELQPKLLRALQEREVERLGGGRSIPVDVRVIAATNQDLAQMVARKQFRADLYYRLNVIPMDLPPLRERIEDIPLLVEYFISKFSTQLNKSIESVPEEVMEVLKAHDWPGNIRELQNVIERGVVLSDGEVLSRQITAFLPKGAPVQERVVSISELSSAKTLADADRAHITATLEKTNWVVGGPRGAAAQLGLPRTTLIAKMQRLGIPTAAPRFFGMGAGALQAVGAAVG